MNEGQFECKICNNRYMIPIGVVGRVRTVEVIEVTSLTGLGDTYSVVREVTEWFLPDGTPDSPPRPVPRTRRRPVMDIAPHLLTDVDGRSLYGSCSHCGRTVDNYDDLHRVSAILRGGRGVECVLRGDIRPAEARPLGFRPEPPSTRDD